MYAAENIRKFIATSIKGSFFAKIVRERAIGLYMPLFTLEEVMVLNSIVPHDTHLDAAEVIARYNKVHSLVDGVKGKGKVIGVIPI
jgi:hypothetical protein